MGFDPRLTGTVNLSSSLFNVSLSGSAPDGCPTVGQASLSASLSLNNALGSTVGLSGQFNLLATSGGGQVGAGLRTLVGVSDSVRIGGGIGGTNVPATSGEGTNYVLNAVGIDPTALNNASQYNASITASATTQASQVYNSVAQGQFTSSMVTGAFQPFQNATQLIGSIFTPSSLTVGSNFGSLCGASPYAVDLIKFAPKYKFLFIIQLEFDPAFQGEVMTSIDPAFVVKSSTRPNVEFEYEEVNMYNFRTKIPKRTVYQPMTMKFYDDDKNNALQFYTTYLKLMSPIAAVNPGSQDPLDMFDQVGGGMGFTSGKPGTIQPQWSGTVSQDYAASLGPFGVNPSTRNILRRITLFHVYKQGRMMNVFNFYNPKITMLELDEVDMSESNTGNEVSFQFSYDSLYIIPGYRIYGGQTQFDLQSMTSEGRYPFGASPSLVPNDGGNSIKDGSRGAMAFGENVENGVGTTSLGSSVANTNITSSNSSNMTNDLSTAATTAGRNADQDASYNAAVAQGLQAKGYSQADATRLSANAALDFSPAVIAAAPVNSGNTTASAGYIAQFGVP